MASLLMYLYENCVQWKPSDFPYGKSCEKHNWGKQTLALLGLGSKRAIDGSRPGDGLQLCFKGQGRKGVHAVLNHSAHGRMPQDAAYLSRLHILYSSTQSAVMSTLDGRCLHVVRSQEADVKYASRQPITSSRLTCGSWIPSKGKGAAIKIITLQSTGTSRVCSRDAARCPGQTEWQWLVLLSQCCIHWLGNTHNCHSVCWGTPRGERCHARARLYSVTIGALCLSARSMYTTSISATVPERCPDVQSTTATWDRAQTVNGAAG